MDKESAWRASVHAAHGPPADGDADEAGQGDTDLEIDWRALGKS